MPFVVDVSAMMPWVLQDEDHPIAAVALVRAASDQIVVPGVWWFEMRNALIIGERRKRITQGDTQRFLRNLARSGLEIDAAPEEPVVLPLARRHRLTVYDAVYLELAHRRAWYLATLDGDLARAARAEGIGLLGIPTI